MLLDNFSFGTDLISIEHAGEYVDIHNSYNFAEMRSIGDTEIIVWNRCVGDWVPSQYPLTIRFLLEKVVFKDVRGKPKEGLSEIGFFPNSTLGRVEYNGNPAPSGGCELLVFRFTNGSEVAF